MAPFDIDTWGSWATPVVHIVLGLLFGFVLERAGFGNAKKLAAQFYLRDMTVLKVMFTAIVTAMLLIHWTVGLGALDLERLWVNPTYLGSGIAGGLLFGAGFVIGGYCPGTSLVAMATLKLDGLFFVLGVMGGIFLFGFTIEPLSDFWHHSGALGTLTLYEWLHLAPPVVVLLALLMALGMFAGGETVERFMRKRAP